MNKTFLAAIAAFVLISALSGCNRTLTYNPLDYAPEIQFIDSLRYSGTEVSYPEEVTVPEDSLLRSWVGFAERFSAQDYSGAYEFTKSENNFSNILMFLRNTTAQYVFITSAWSEVIFEVEASEDFYREMDELLNLNLALVKSAIQAGSEVPPHYTDLLKSMGYIYRLTGDKNVADAFCNEIYEGYMACGYGDITSRLAVLYYRVQFMSDYGMNEEALSEVRSFKDIVLNECPEEELPSALEILVQLEDIATPKE